MDQDRALCIGDLDLAIEHGERAMTIRSYLDDKLRSADRSVCCRSLDIHFLRLFATKEIARALLKVQACLLARGPGRQNLSFEKLIDSENARVTQSNCCATIFTCPQPIAPGQLLTDDHWAPLSF